MIGSRDYHPHLRLCFDASSDQSLPSILGPWTEYSGGSANYTVVNNNTVVLKNTSTAWIGYYLCNVGTTGQYTIMFDYWATSDGSTLVLDNDGIMDNTYNTSLTANIAKQSYTGTVNVTTTGEIRHFFRRNGGGSITVSNVRYVKSDTYKDIVTGLDLFVTFTIATLSSLAPIKISCP